MTRDGMSMEASRGITDEHSDSSSLLSANDTTPTNSADTTQTNSIHVCISKPTIVPRDQNLIINSNSDTEIIDVLSLVSDNRTPKRSFKSLSNKDKCPCSTSDTASWKPKYSKCKQAWNTACCYLLGIASITELENWECPWCYVLLFRDPSKSSISTSVLEELKTNIQSIDNKCSNFNFPELQNQINDLKNAISSFSSSDSSHVCVNKIHDDVIASIKFELQNIVANPGG